MADSSTPLSNLMNTKSQFLNYVQTTKPSIFDQAMKEWPILQSLGVSYKSSPNAGGDNLLEFWHPGEMGDKEQPRPKELPPDRPGVEVYSDKTRPIDILGDVVSHYMVTTDPTIKSYYEQFEKSLTAQQKQNLKEQYQWAQKNEGEKRPYEEWEKVSGIPAYFRGYAFQQWQNAEKMYTPEQINMFNKMMGYLKGNK